MKRYEGFIESFTGWLIWRRDAALERLVCSWKGHRFYQLALRDLPLVWDCARCHLVWCHDDDCGWTNTYDYFDEEGTRSEPRGRRACDLDG